MRQLEFVIAEWLGGEGAESAATRATMSALRIEAGTGALTRVEDTLARTLREHIYVPASAVAEWLLSNFWRLRWEPRPPSRRASPEWRFAHSVAAIGGGYAWPPLDISSDGEFVEIALDAEGACDVSSIRFLESATYQIRASDFEAAIDRLTQRVEARLAECVPSDRSFSELRAELDEERSDPMLARACRLQAAAGIDPGDATQEWLRAAAEIADLAGNAAAQEVATVSSRLTAGFDTARGILENMRTSSTTLDLGWAGSTTEHDRALEGDPPWQRGARLAQDFRHRMGVSAGTVTSERLSELLGLHLPVAATPAGVGRVLSGGYRNGQHGDRVGVLVPSARLDSQRFYFARLVACASVAAADSHLLPVTDASTALQKLQRSFAQELLCPWAELDAFTDERGLDDDAIAEAADHFQVSQLVVLSTLVNEKKLPRWRVAG